MSVAIYVKVCVRKSYLVADDGLFDGGEVLKRGKNDVSPGWATNVLSEATKLLTQGDQNFILIFDRLCKARLDTARKLWRDIGRKRNRRTIEERDQLISGSLSAESKGNGGESMNGIESEEDIVMLWKGVSRGVAETKEKKQKLVVTA